MKLITKQSLVAPAIAWYLKNAPHYVGKYSAWTQEGYDKMLKLNPSTCTVEQLTEVKGNASATWNHCDECQQDFDTLLHIGAEPDYDVRYQRLCKGCLTKALGML